MSHSPSLRSSSASPSPTLPGRGVLPVAAGVYHARRGEWHAALAHLRSLLHEPSPELAGERLPSLAWSYLGQALARCERRHAQAEALCWKAIDLEFYEPENWLNLAWVSLLARDRKAALHALESGLKVHGRHGGLLRLRAELGRRRAPVVGFLPRSHRINLRLGRFLDGWRARGKRED